MVLRRPALSGGREGVVRERHIRAGDLAGMIAY